MRIVSNSICLEPLFIRSLGFSLGSPEDSSSSTDAKSGNAEVKSDNTLRTVAMILVLVVWTVNMLLDAFLVDKYDPSPFVHGAMMLVLGRLMGVRIAGGKS